MAPLVPTGRSGAQGGRPPVPSRRDIVDAIRYLAHNGCVWRALPADFPPWQTVYDYHARWTRDYDAGKHVNGRKRHIATDTIGLLLVVAVSAASVQDRHAGHALI